jgi:tripartite ATP-independent transporter DctM subunit
LIWIFITAVLVLLLIGIPVPFAFGLVSLFYLFQLDIPLMTLPQRMVAGADSFPLMAIPLFILAGVLMNNSGATKRLLGLAEALVGHMRGGLAQVNVVSSMLFAGMTGSSTADAAGLGNVNIRMMREKGYNVPFAAAVTAASSTIGPLIPPSIPIIIYGALAQVSTGKLLIGGAVPGILLGILFMILVYIMAIKNKYPTNDQFKMNRVVKAITSSIPELMMPIILVGGIISGYFTPTEAAAVTVVYGLALTLLVRRDLKLADLPKIFMEAGLYTGIMMFIVTSTSIFNWLLIREQFGQELVDMILATGVSPNIMILLIILITLLVGCFLETISALMLIVPVLAPIALVIGMDPIHLGILIVVTLQVGLITPPVGLSMYIVTTVANISMGQFVRAIIPFFIVMVILVLLIAYIPQISMFLPNLMVTG